MPRRSAANPDGLKIFDTHCHLNDRQFANDLNAVMKRAYQAGVKEILTVSTSVPDSQENVILCRKYPNTYCAVGIHPHEADSFRSFDIQTLKDMCIEPQVKAIGETGLDFFRGFSTKANQETAFRAQIELAKMLNLPLVIHIRDAAQPAMAILEEHGYFKGILHCFSDGRKFAEWAVEKGFYISFAGSLTYGEKRLIEVAKTVPQDRILIETDAPYLIPEPERGPGKRNEPAFIRLTLQFLAQALNFTPAEVADLTRENAHRCLQIT
ncbi:MAG: TatD family hydrolase [candidate division WOR-3 bacterium]